MKTLNQINKKTTLALAFVAMSTGTFATHAAANSQKDATPSEADNTVLIGAASGAAMGAMVGGPIGAVVGGVFGIMLGNDVEQDNKLDETQAQLLASQRSLSEMNSELIAWQQKAMLQPVTVVEPAPLILPELTTSIQFRTGQSHIEGFYSEQLSLVGDMLNSFSGLSVHVSGYADPRGSDKENKVLSLKRAEAIMAALIGNGVSQNQISISAMGEVSSNTDLVTSHQNVEDYFFDRKVVMTIAPREKILTASNK